MVSFSIITLPREQLNGSALITIIVQEWKKIILNIHLEMFRHNYINPFVG